MCAQTSFSFMQEEEKPAAPLQGGCALLLDGHAMAYRAFYGIRDLATSGGCPTNALFGFIRMLGYLKTTWSPTHWVMTFDCGLPEKRTALLPDYKGQRPPMPDDLRSQIDLIDRFLECVEIPVLRVPGQEADDVLATLAVQGEAAGAKVFIASSDKDLYQVIRPGIEMVAPARKGTRMDVDAVREKTGVLPEQIIDWLSLIGDSADNIPGVPGVGPKTATKWLQQYQTLDGLLEQREAVKPERFRAVLAEQQEQLKINRQLVELDTAVVLEPVWERAAIRDADAARVRDFLEEYELHSLIREWAR
jgi:DNA polymerase-1